MLGAKENKVLNSGGRGTCELDGWKRWNAKGRKVEQDPRECNGSGKVENGRKEF